MLRGITLFKCTQCGKRFIGPDMELIATVYSAPCKCPQCGSFRTRPSRLVNPFVSTSLYNKVWEEMETKKKA